MDGILVRSCVNEQFQECERKMQQDKKKNHSKLKKMQLMIL
jgi:hypothetical protein